MATSLNEQISAFNQEALERELTSALIIRDQLKDVLERMAEHQKSDITKTLQNQILNATNETLRAMLEAENQEIFDLHENRLRELVKEVREKFTLPDDSGTALAQYAARNLLKKTSFEKREEIAKDFEALPENFKKHPNYDQWRQEFEALATKTTETDFNELKKQILDGFLKHEAESDIANLASLSLVDEHIRLLHETRETYLEKTSRKSKLLKDIAWVGLGVGLVTAAAVLAIAFPPLIIAGLVVGGAAAAYSIIDLGKQGAELKEEIDNHKLRNRLLTDANKDSFISMAKKLGIHDAQDFLQQQQLKNEGLTREKKVTRGLAIGASAAALALGVAALAVAIPFIGAPIAAAIGIAVASVAVVGFIAGLLGYKRNQEQKKLKECKDAVEKQTTEDKKLMDEIQPTLGPKLSSVAVIREEIGLKEDVAQENAVKQTHVEEKKPLLKEDTYQSADEEISEEFERLAVEKTPKLPPVIDHKAAMAALRDEASTDSESEDESDSDTDTDHEGESLLRN